MPQLSGWNHQRYYYYKDDTTVTKARRWEWDGDDIRWTRRMKRRWDRLTSGSGRGGGVGQRYLVLTNALLFLYQIVNTVDYIRRKNPSYWPSQAIPMTWDAMLGSSILGPLTMDFVYSNALSQQQPHRFLTAGFIHGGLLHFLLNMDALRRIPSWLETGMGTPIFLTTFIVSIITGNIGHTVISTTSPYDPTLCLGASGGICGLYGLLYTALVKMGNKTSASRIVKGMAMLLLYGCLMDNVSNSAHIGGFLGGIVIGILCCPSYKKSYSMRRKWSLEVDIWPKGYRQAMGFGVTPTSRGFIPVTWIWIVAILSFLSIPKYRLIPSMILKGLLRPGTLYSLA